MFCHSLNFFFAVPRPPGALICYSSGFVKKGCALNCICYFHMLAFTQVGSAHLIWWHVCMCVCACMCVFFYKRGKGWGFSRRKHTYVFCVPQLLQYLKSQGGSHSCNVFGRISCILATQMSRKTKSWLYQKDLARFHSLLIPHPGHAWTPGLNRYKTHTGEAWAWSLIPAFRNVGPVSARLIRSCQGGRWANEEGKIMGSLRKRPHISWIRCLAIFISIVYYSEIENQEMLSVKNA